MRHMDMRSKSGKRNPAQQLPKQILRYYCLSILDKHHHPDISFEQGMKLLQMCSDELKRRLPIDFKGVSVKICQFIPTKEALADLGIIAYREDR